MIETILLILLIALSAADTFVILMQEGNENSLGAITGTYSENSYIKKNGKRTLKHRLKTVTCVLSAAVLALVIALLVV